MDRVLRKERERALSQNPSQWTFSFLKPESLKRRIVGEVISRLERKGLILKEARLHQITIDEAETLYSVHKGKPFFRELVEHVISGPVLLMVLEGPSAVETLRKIIGATNPLMAEPGSIRGDFSVSIAANVIHASDSIENARREAAIFFPEL